ncbi:MAG: hypothetical protein B7Z78_03060 [Rhodospirillales bacterium 20-60-12]|nr:MAG: hypothetical protein B7Z78_03060 [Rhodospirillales bacterium 20-60-12]HQT66364.1 Hint domain-containing protein [Acetobacteraceae bacterium]
MASTITGTVTNTVTFGQGGYGSALSLTSTGDISPSAASATGVYLPPHQAIASLINDGTIGAGNGAPSTSLAGGTGGTGVSIAGSINLTNSGLISGGIGGSGYYGGNGGLGIDILGSGSMSNLSIITGGAGYGNGVAINIGGSGGTGIELRGTYATMSNNDLIEGGAGGAGYFGGNGGVAVTISNGDLLINSGTITGGAGGVGGGPGLGGTGAVAVLLDGGTLVDTGTISGGAGGANAVAIQFGTLTSTLEIAPNAVIEGNVAASASAHDILALAGGQGSLSGMGTSFTGFGGMAFEPSGAWQVAGSYSAFTSLHSITGFTLGDTLTLAGFTETSDIYVNGAGLEIGNAFSTITLALMGNFTTADFAVATSGGASTVAFSSAAPCFTAGTRILTIEDEIPVEDLQPGDELVLHGGGSAKIIWIGRRHVNIAGHAHPNLVAPVLIEAGAILDGVPKRDLIVSPDHAIFLGGHLIPAKALINGATIRQCSRQMAVTYFHIELADHAVIYAEGTPAETYLDTGNRGAFEQAGMRVINHPVRAQALRTQLSCAPFAEHGKAVETVRAQIIRRADIQTTREPGLAIINRADGSVLIKSRCGVPGHILADPRDCRALGVKISAIRADAETINLADPALAEGWYDLEPDGIWTNGHALIPAKLVKGRTIRVDLAATATYIVPPTQIVPEPPKIRRRA